MSDDSNHRGGKDYNEEPPLRVAAEIKTYIIQLFSDSESVDRIQRLVWLRFGAWLPIGFIERILVEDKK